MIKISRLFLLALALAFSFNCFAQRSVTHYAKASLNTTLNLHWTPANYGTVQWQQSKDKGTTWTNIANATSPTYTFKTGASGETWLRVVVNGDEACEPYTETHIVKVVNFTVNLEETAAFGATFSVSGLNIPASEIVEYGYCANYNGLSRAYTSMPRTAIGTTLPEGNPFEVTCEGLLPAKSYSVRLYFKTADGSIVFGPGKLVKTLPGIEWDTEGWAISKNTITARFKVSGLSGAAPQMRFEFGTEGNMKTYSTAAVTGQTMTFRTTMLRNLQPATQYIARVWADLDGDEQVIEKTVTTLPDYSTYPVDNTVKPVGHRIVWQNARTPIQLNPDNIQAEYPRMLRISADTLLLAYHGGDGAGRGVDHWHNIYLCRSIDNGKTWSEPEKLMDNTKTWTHSWFRFCNPELVKLQNGWVLMTFGGNGNPETNENCEVLVMISKDSGQTWGDPITVMRGRTWEPMIVQLPGGDLELLVSSEAAWWPDNQGPQEIRSARSTDNGQTWTTSVRATYNPGMRDGMPVIVNLQGNKGVLFSIECPGSNVTPSLVHRNLKDPWENGDWDRREDSERWHNNNIEGGCAPHMIQLTTGEIVMAAHNGQNGSVWQTCRSQVSIGDNTGHNFGSRTIPFSWLPAGQGAYYASLFQKDEETIWLIISHSTYDGTVCTKNTIEYIEGKIVEK